MKKRILAIFLVLVIALVGCGQKDKKSGEKDKKLEKITVIVALKSSKEMVELKRDDLKKAGYDLDIKEITDYNLFNQALNNKEGDVNFGVHELYMNFFNKKQNGKLVKVGNVYDAVCAFYSPKYKNVKEIEDGAVTFLPNDPVNKSRALRLLEVNGLLTFKDPNQYIVDVKDIKDNIKNLQFKEVSLDQLIPAYEEPSVGLVWYYPAYASKINLYPDKNGLIVEKTFDDKYSIMVAAREDNKNDPKVKKFVELMQTKEVADYINTKLKGEAVPAFKY